METLFSVEATSEDRSESNNLKRVLLGVQHMNREDVIQKPTQLRWMHLSNQKVEFDSFLRLAFEAYGLKKHAQSGAVSKLVDHLSAGWEQSMFEGKKFRTVPASSFVQFPDEEERRKVNFMAVPYFLLQKPQMPPKRTTNRSKAHWVQPLVQSHYHLDSSRAREEQQAIRRLYTHIKEIIHIPQLWILSIGDKFVATYAPTPLYDAQRSSITTRTIGRSLFPPTIRVTKSSGYTVCLDRNYCGVWFEFVYHVYCTIGVPEESRDWVYRLENDRSLVEGSRWRALLQSHPHNQPLFILVSPGEPEAFKPFPRTIQIYPADAATILKEVDQRVKENHRRRLSTVMQDDYSRPSPHDIENPYYVPPLYVLDAAKFQAKKEGSQSQGALNCNLNHPPTSASAQKVQFSEKLPIFQWAIINTSGTDKPPPINDPTPSQRMRSLLAHIHRNMLFTTDSQFARTYNNLSLRTKLDVQKLITQLRLLHPINGHILDLVSSFVLDVNAFLEQFIEKDYNCLVKGKVWAALHTVVKTFQPRYSAALFSFHIDILSLPIRQFISELQSLREGLSGVEEPYITCSMETAFVATLQLFVNAESEATRLMTSSDNKGEAGTMPNSDNISEQPGNLPASTIVPNESNVVEGQGKQPVSPALNTQTNKENRARSPAREAEPTKGAQSSGHTEGPGDEQDTWSLRLDEDLNHIFTQLDTAQRECCATFGPKNDEAIYSISDSGTVVALILESVLRGHSLSESMPILDIGDIYNTYTTFMQLEARNRPSRNLLLELNLLREELEIIISNISQQVNLLSSLRNDNRGRGTENDTDSESDEELSIDYQGTLKFERLYSSSLDGTVIIDMSIRKVLKDVQTSLQDRLDIFEELNKRVHTLERQIVQRVDIIQEDHGKAILVFTIVSTIFLPLSFVSSYLGMNTADIRDMELSQALFWQVAAPFTVLVISVVLVVAYNASHILGWFSRRPTLP
ncbi:hypothetical protein BDV09DRAFT_189492 [Aspergillus tetrazonus]